MISWAPFSRERKKTIKRNGQSMAMSNGGETIELVDQAGRVIQTVTYSQASEGEAVVPVN